MKELILRTDADLEKLHKLLAAGKRPERIIAYKAVRKPSRRSPNDFVPPIYYLKDAVIKLDRLDKSPKNCSYGINIATYNWIRRTYARMGDQYQCLRVLVTGRIVIPMGYFHPMVSGKFRTNKITVLN